MRGAELEQPSFGDPGPSCILDRHANLAIPGSIYIHTYIHTYIHICILNMPRPLAIPVHHMS